MIWSIKDFPVYDLDERELPVIDLENKLWLMRPLHDPDFRRWEEMWQTNALEKPGKRDVPCFHLASADICEANIAQSHFDTIATIIKTVDSPYHHGIIENIHNLIYGAAMSFQSANPVNGRCTENYLMAFSVWHRLLKERNPKQAWNLAHLYEAENFQVMIDNHWLPEEKKFFFTCFKELKKLVSYEKAGEKK